MKFFPIKQHSSTFAEEGYNRRAISDFFVAALRALGEMDAECGVEYGKKYSAVILDHRAMRSLVVFLRRKEIIWMLSGFFIIPSSNTMTKP